VPLRILQHLAVFVLYSLGVSAAVFLLPPAAGLPLALLILWILLRFYLLGTGKAYATERAALLRLRPLSGPVLRWILAGAPVMLLLSWSLGELYLRLVPVPSRVLNPFGPLMLDPMQQLVIAVLAIALAPVVEEMVFRGLIQHPLEHRLGVGSGIAVASLIFALVHIDTLPWVIPLHALLGAIFGWAVYTTRSIWAGVILHAVNNCAAFLGLEAETPPARPLLWEGGADAEWWFALGTLSLALVMGAWIARGLKRAAAA
jgi:membrane protease YdiL (CAAX protease family)